MTLLIRMMWWGLIHACNVGIELCEPIISIADFHYPCQLMYKNMMNLALRGQLKHTNILEGRNIKNYLTLNK